jgi:hypothetical protein
MFYYGKRLHALFFYLKINQSTIALALDLRLSTCTNMGVTFDDERNIIILLVLLFIRRNQKCTSSAIVARCSLAFPVGGDCGRKPPS